MSFILTMILVLLNSCNNHQVNSADFTIQKVAHPAGDTVQTTGNNIMVIHQDKKNNYWFGSWQDGVYRYDGKTTVHFTTKDGLPHQRIEEIREDKDGNIFFNTSGGVCRYDGKQFITLTESANATQNWQLLPDDIWFKCPEQPGHVYRYDGANLHRLKLPETEKGRTQIAKHPNSPNPYDVYCIYRDSKGRVWFGTAVLGALCYDGVSFMWIEEEDVTELHDGPSNGVRSIIEDKDGYFWFNSNFRYKVHSDAGPVSRMFYTREESIGSLDGKDNGNISEYLSITKDNNHHLWIATYRDGVWQYDGNKVVHHQIKNGTEDITLFYIYKDNSGTLWLGTHNNGIYKFNGKSFERFQPD